MPRFLKGPSALNLLSVAERTGRSPSEMFGIGCSWCAYCFDEALMYRASLRANDELKKAKDEADFDALHRQTMQDPEWA